MRHIVFPLLFMTGSAFAQVAAPADSLDVRAIESRLNSASVEMRKAAWSRNTSVVGAAVGAIFTAMACDKGAKVYNERAAIGLGALTGAWFFTFQLKGAHHDRAASKYLHQ